MDKLEADIIDEQNAEQAREWGFWNRFLIGDPNDVYLDRLTLITTPWFSIKLHRIYRPDQQRDLHNHPWCFFSLVLWGWYTENTQRGERRVRWFNWKTLEDFHCISLVSRSPVWTLVFTGPRRQVWGFMVKDPDAKCQAHFRCAHRFVVWSEYEKLNNP